MSKTQEEIVRGALALPPEARAELAERLLDSITPSDVVDVDDSWAQEAERRLQAYESGEVQAIPASEVFRELLAKVRRK